MKIYTTNMCRSCTFKPQCTTAEEGRRIHRWEHQEVIDKWTRDSIMTEKGQEIIRMRKELAEHTSGTMKRNFEQDYLLMKDLRKVNGELGFTVLAYNLRRAFNILGTAMMVSALTFWRPKAIHS